ncbi:hypothetical protein XENTR_v10017652 [Xenopus tropicalis]|nr:hypothetical protein XENTR_v10017652 [Xenopus tropicalis]
MHPRLTSFCNPGTLGASPHVGCVPRSLGRSCYPFPLPYCSLGPALPSMISSFLVVLRRERKNKSFVDVLSSSCLISSRP